MASSSSCVLPVGINMEKMQQISKLVNGDDNPFKCAVCKHYLSISPIVLNTVLGSICGRDLCKKLAASQGTNYRQKAYEGLAKVFEFPCMYKESGCKEVLPWNEIGEHELICEFVKLCCPFSTDHFEDEKEICTWKGNTTEILGHMQEVHSPHRFENYVQISLKQDIKKNKLFFSRILDSIVILLVVIGAESDTYWKIWTVPVIWRNLNYKIEISSEKGQSLTVSKFQEAGLLYPTFFKSKIDNSWFKINFDCIRNFFDSAYFLTTKFYLKGFLIGSPIAYYPHISLWRNVKCHKCGKLGEKSMFVCRSDKKHTICDICKNSQDPNFNHYCPMCFPTGRCILDRNFLSENVKILFNQLFEYCILCAKNVQCLSSHLSNIHSESIFELGECHNFRLKYYFFSFDDHIFLLSNEFNKNGDLTFSVQCLETLTVKYKYELKLMSSKTSCSAITFASICHPALINVIYIAGENLDDFTHETLMPRTLYTSTFPAADGIEFKLNIFKI